MTYGQEGEVEKVLAVGGGRRRALMALLGQGRHGEGSRGAGRQGPSQGSGEKE